MFEKHGVVCCKCMYVFTRQRISQQVVVRSSHKYVVVKIVCHRHGRM